MTNLQNKVAFVTGSTSGIGLTMARSLAAKGCHIVITGFGDQDEINKIKEDIVREFKVNVNHVSCDLRKVEEIDSMCAEIDKLYPEGIDILCNNAGFNHVHPIEGYPTEWWNDSVAVMLTAPFHLIKHFLPKMRAKGWGRIVNTASQHGMVSTAGKAVYSAVKHGIVGLTKGVALDIGDANVTINCICPGFASSNITKAWFERLGKERGCSAEEAKASVLESVPNKKMVELQHIADMMLYLCSESAVSITGAAMLMDGGYTAQ
ncbi:unnamed protein product [Owenia fusiformis]|uniref:3-oxoacyl-[acyl-carrier-protein] reductase n=1 Tax=Owenia fusiformis TaxID=6347 RepID=A0A8J1U4S1_OWEFU|nr:unnamed protein product [Owenia fusiformis]